MRRRFAAAILAILLIASLLCALTRSASETAARELELFMQFWQAVHPRPHHTLLLCEPTPDSATGVTTMVLGVLWADWTAVHATLKTSSCGLALQFTVDMVVAQCADADVRHTAVTARFGRELSADSSATLAWLALQLDRRGESAAESRLHVIVVVIRPAPDNEFAWIAAPSPSAWPSALAWSPPMNSPAVTCVPVLVSEYMRGVLAMAQMRPGRVALSLQVGTWSASAACNKSRAARFAAELNNGALPPLLESDRLFSDHAFHMLLVAKHTLDALQIPFWLNSGTLLGYYRQCSIIGHSKDVDIGVFASDYSFKMVSAMESAGLLLTHRFGRPSDSYELSFTNQHGVKLDVFFFYPEVQGDGFWNGGTQARSGKKFKYSFPHFKPMYTAFLGLAVRIPHPTLAFVQANYGVTEWQHPVKNWDWKKSPANVQPNGEWPANEWSEVVQCATCKFPVKLLR